MTNIDDLARNDSMGHRVEWSCEITYNEHLYQVAWVAYFPYGKDDTPYGYWLSVWQDGQELDRDTPESRMIKSAASNLRASEVGLSPSERPYGHEAMLQEFLRIALMAIDNEFIGQHSMAYVADVARVLDLPHSMALDYADILRARGEIGLSGFILVSAEKDAEGRKLNEEWSGHKDYDSSDMGEMWWCRACGKSGDTREGPSPRDVPCERVDSE